MHYLLQSNECVWSSSLSFHKSSTVFEVIPHIRYCLICEFKERFQPTDDCVAVQITSINRMNFQNEYMAIVNIHSEWEIMTFGKKWLFFPGERYHFYRTSKSAADFVFYETPGSFTNHQLWNLTKAWAEYNAIVCEQWHRNECNQFQCLRESCVLHFCLRISFNVAKCIHEVVFGRHLQQC